ncbi:AI-2E family transporter [Ideonella sp.]|uniref:AI-2E family transporter n=1 Tax=Ideonella sp. TaxID=1929293 RepID=UPI0035B439E2
MDMTTNLAEHEPAHAPAARAEPALPDEPPRLRLHMPVDVRSASMALIAFLLCVYALHWAAAVAIPLLLGLMFSYALSPLVDRLERWRVPRGAGAAVVVAGIVIGLGWTTYALGDDAAELVQALPTAAQKLRVSLRERMGTSPGALDKVQRAATEIERVADERSPRALPSGQGITQVQVVQPKFNIHDYLWSGTLGLIALVGQASVVCLLTYFLLASGSTFRRKMVRIAGPTLSQKKITVQVLDEITEQIQRYLLVQLVISAAVGVATGLAFWWLGVQHPVVWGVAALVLNLVPYVGSLALMAAAMLSALMQFGTLEMALMAGGACLVIHMISGNLLAPWLTSRASRLSPVAVFVAVLVWGWLWGVWGMLLGVPIIMVVKATCDHVEGFKPVGELLGG